MGLWAPALALVCMPCPVDSTVGAVALNVKADSCLGHQSVHQVVSQPMMGYDQQ